MITSLLPAWLEARICLRLRQHGLNPVYLVQCLFLLCHSFYVSRIAVGVSFDKKGLLEAAHQLSLVSCEIKIYSSTTASQ